ncbi:cache domain-containing protein [Roseospira navarrensis]|uniref:histidine kinase n=1 Tax=Roseospira navarrensis TaxID=140058 RepID=A0A7X2D3M3_9PROT|nr:cache domain-containing protein [Roseospira navarrensis]MQX35335.1 hypothetical protein [Roseospira navarrensis]
MDQPSGQDAARAAVREGTLPPSRRGGRPGIVRALSLRLFAASAVAFVGLYAYWSYGVYQTMTEEAAYRAETLLEERRTYIRALVETAVNGADHQRRTVNARARQVLRERGQRAQAIARHIWETRPEDATRRQVLEQIRETLRPIRFDGGRGYYYAFIMDTGETILHADSPDLEGTDLRVVRDLEGRPIVPSLIDYLREHGEGFYNYVWEHPNRPGKNHAKIAYGVLFEPLNLGIAVGDYLEDMTATVKAETLAQLEAMRFGDDGYIFAGTWDGISLIEPARGRDMWAVTDPNGVKVVQELVGAARAGGGFVRYVRPNLQEGYPRSERLSYVLPVPEWEWYVGAGVSIDDINATIADVRREIRSDALRSLVLGSLLVALLAAASSWIALRSARRVGRDFARLEAALAEDGRNPDRLQADALRHAESHRLAIAIHGMVERRDAAERALEQQSRKLERSNAELERFAYVASHDLREPLRIVSSYVGLLRRRYHGQLDADADTFIDFVTEGAQRMHDMIGDLLEYSRIKRSATPFEAVDLNEVCAQAVQNLTASIRETDARVQIASALPTVRGRRPMLISLFQNLLENAIKYRNPDRTPDIRVRGGIRDGEAVVDVADNGLGIDPAFHARIFQIFQRLHAAHRYPGTGVGLSICQNICESHGGRIWLDSEQGRGTTFHVALPLTDGTEASPDGADSARETAPAR